MKEKKNKELAIRLLREKLSNEMLWTYEEISNLTHLSKSSLIRIMKAILEKKDTVSILLHGNAGKKSHKAASDQEINFIRNLKLQYPVITIAQFRDIFIEDFYMNPNKQDIVSSFGLHLRSLSWFRNLFITEGWSSPHMRHTLKTNHSIHLIRVPSTKSGFLVQIDGTPFDWFGSGEMWTLHLAVDDATSDVLSGYFMPTERQLGYCHMMKYLFEEYGVPSTLYSDRHTIFHNKTGELTQFGQMMNDLGIRMIFAGSPQAKGRIERYNGTCQSRLPNDIKRFGIKDYDELNVWFNTTYRKYLNQKFARNPIDPHSAFMPIEVNLSEIFTLRYIRKINNGIFSFQKNYYAPVDDDGKPYFIKSNTEVNVRIDVFTEDVFIIRYGKVIHCKIVSSRTYRQTSTAENQKELSLLLHEEDED